MAKTKTAFICQTCGTQAPKWMGQCPGCNEWNTLIEEVILKEKKGGIISKESFIHISNLKLINDKAKTKKTEAKK